jgi:zinc protease
VNANVARSLVVCLLAGVQAPGIARAAADMPELAYETYTLPNGLRVILHEDHALPVVAVNVWYHTGSKNEKPGRTGFAHLFEHMMFQGSQHHDADFFLPLQKVGGTVNGSTTQDRTNYWENVPREQLELALWLESDRMGWLVPAMTQERLDNQRDVVKNEKRQGENQPYALVRDLRLQLMYPEGHPYRWPVIGSMDDLSAASLDDVKDFFQLYYAPNNASLCLAGDFDPAEAKRLIAQYFGPIPPGRPVQRVQAWLPHLDGEVRAIAEDDVELPRLYLSWHVPGFFAADEAELNLLAEVLSDGKASRLYRALVYEREVAQDVAAFVSGNELSGMFLVQATARPGVELADLEAAVDAELNRLKDGGVTKDELALAQASYETDFVRRLQRVGGFGGKADLLNRYQVMAGTPGYLEQDLARFQGATAAGVRDAARRWLRPDGRAVIHVVPHGKLSAGQEEVARDTMPVGQETVDYVPPRIESTTLANGLEVCLVRKTGLPLVAATLAIRSGWSSDPADRPGTAALTAELLDEGTSRHDALGLENAARRLGAELSTRSTFDASQITLNLLGRHLDEGLALMAEVAREPRFPAAEFERQRKLYLGRIQQESMQPTAVAMKILQEKVFGPGHAYAQPFSGTGTVAGLEALSSADLAAFHAAHYVPGNAVLCLVGDLTLDQARTAAERFFGSWPAGTAAPPVVPDANPDRSARIFLVDRPGAQQSTISAAYPGLRVGDPDRLALEVLNTALGGQFASRLNLNLREDKGYTYGVRTQVAAFANGGFFGTSTQVQTPHTAASIVEILEEFAQLRGPRPLAGEELQNCASQMVLSFPQDFETYGGVAGRIAQLVVTGQPRDDWQTYAARVRGVTAEDLPRVAQRLIRPDDLVFVIVGDRARIEDDLRALGLGPVRIVTPEGGV